MNTANHIAAVVLAASLSACALNQSDAAAALNKTDPIKCQDKAACDLLWERLQLGIEQMTAHKFSERTPTRLRQFLPSMDSVHPFVNLASRIDAPDGSALITLDIWCMNPFGCPLVSPEELGVSLRKFVVRPR